MNIAREAKHIMQTTNLKEPLVSIVTPTYNAGQFIAEAIESVIKQSFADWEMLVVDDGSTDDTNLVVQAYLSRDHRITYFSLGCNSRRPSVPRNYGIRRAQGKYVAFLDSDDAWHPSKIEKQLAFFRDKGIVGVGTDAIFISETPYYRQIYYGKGREGYIDYDYRYILHDNPIRTSSVIVRKDELLAVGGFDENLDFRFIEDWDLWLRMAREGKFRILEDRFLFYRVFTDKSRDKADSARRCFKVLEKHLGLGYINQEDTKESRASINLAIGRGLLHADDPKCRQYFLKAIRDSSLHSKRLRALIGYLLSFLPPVLRQPTLRGLYAADKACRAIRDLAYPKSSSVVSAASVERE